ncbi:hypothetical protein [Streptomyces atratus]|uniref:Novel STAND NTPase 3 domain-containing protein n=1 Tax=Streptomyces atratus TaxID=1893 RepID=A0A2Z5JMX8_STRAR|nr:hypothetical protein [Streptomyces atratus]AXE80735.1 hypothetical protein C5746_31430 [Streptomyces atratus]
MSDKPLPDEAVHTTSESHPAREDLKHATTKPAAGDGTVDEDGPISESDALRSLAAGGGESQAERAEALRAGAIADLIAERLNADASGTRIGTLALFNDSVSFGGGFNTNGGSGPSARLGATDAVLLTEDEITEYTDLYVQPQRYDEALDALCERHLLVLTGAPGSGRTAAAVNLLAEALTLNSASDGGCHRLLDAASIASPTWEPPAERSGSLAVLDGRLAGLSSRGLASAASKLRAAGAHLVLIGGPELEVVVSGPGGDDLAWHQLSPVDPLAVLERAVLGHSGDADRRAELVALLDSSGAVAALRERPLAAHAVRLASVIRAGGDLGAAVTALRDPSDQVYTWFRTHHEPDTIAFALAVAVLENSGYLTVADAAIRLRQLLSPEEPAPPDVRFRDRLLQEQPWIELLFPGPGDQPGPPRVRFRSALLSQVVLTYAWTTLDGRREAVLQWLRRLLGHSDLEVRAQAAVAGGVLARADFHFAVHRFVKSWAGSTSWPVRQAAATAIGVAGSAPATAEPVWALLHEWACGGQSAHERRLASTAATAVGGLFGRNSPDRALDVLRSALDRGDDWGTLTPVAWGGVHLLHQGLTTEVLGAYLDWSQPRDTSPMVLKTLSAFVFAVSTPYTSSVPGGTGTEGAIDGVPLLLSVLPDHRPELAELWGRALARKPVQEPAFEALRGWVDTPTNVCPEAQASLRTLMLDIARLPGKHRERLHWWLMKWATDRERPSAHAEGLARALEH